MVLGNHIPEDHMAAQGQVKKRKLEMIEDTSEQTPDNDNTQSIDDKDSPIDQSQDSSDISEGDSDVSSMSSDELDDDLGEKPYPDADPFWRDLGDPMMSEQSESDSGPDGEFEGSEKPSLDELEKKFLANKSRSIIRIGQTNAHTGMLDRYYLNGHKDEGKTDEELDQRKIVDWSKFDKWARWGMVEDESGEYLYDKTTGTFRRPYGHDVFLASSVDEDGEAVMEADGKYGVKVGRKVKREDGGAIYETDGEEKKEKKTVKKAAKRAAKKARKESIEKELAKQKSVEEEATISTRKMEKRAEATNANLDV